MWWFKEASKLILLAVSNRCPKSICSKRVELPGISVVQCLPCKKFNILTYQMQAASYKALLGAQRLLEHKDHKVDFLENSKVEEMEKCWEMLGSIKKIFPGHGARRQVR